MTDEPSGEISETPCWLLTSNSPALEGGATVSVNRAEASSDDFGNSQNRTANAAKIAAAAHGTHHRGLGGAGVAPLPATLHSISRFRSRAVCTRSPGCLTRHAA